MKKNERKGKKISQTQREPLGKSIKPIKFQDLKFVVLDFFSEVGFRGLCRNDGVR